MTRWTIFLFFTAVLGSTIAQGQPDTSGLNPRYKSYLNGYYEFKAKADSIFLSKDYGSAFRSYDGLYTSYFPFIASTIFPYPNQKQKDIAWINSETEYLKSRKDECDKFVKQGFIGKDTTVRKEKIRKGDSCCVQKDFKNALKYFNACPYATNYVFEQRELLENGMGCGQNIDFSGFYWSQFTFINPERERHVYLHLKNDSTYSLVIFKYGTKKLYYKEKGTWRFKDSLIFLKNKKRKELFKDNKLQLSIWYRSGVRLIYILSDRFMKGELEFDYKTYGLNFTFKGKEDEDGKTVMGWFFPNK